LGEAEWDDSENFVTQIDSQNIIFVTNDANPTELITIQGLKAIFSGAQSSWQEDSFAGEIISVWTYPEGSELNDWLKEIFIGSSSFGRTQKLAPNPGAMLEAVSNDPAAIGYLPDAWLTVVDQQVINKIKVLEIENNEEEHLPLPVLAYLKEKPAGEVRDFLLCLQAQ
jgi:ABC-type phosphate transport system substrate-binding protein